MLLHLSGPAGVSLAVCDPACARVAVGQLGVKVRTVTAEEPVSVDDCRHCVACGGIVEAPVTRLCWRHPSGCPAWDYIYTASATLVVRRLVIERGQTLSDEGLQLLERVLDDLARDPERLDPEVAYWSLVARLPPSL